MPPLLCPYMGTLEQPAADVLAERTGIAKHRAAVVLGSGWRAAADSLGEPVATVPMADLPGFRHTVRLGTRRHGAFDPCR